MKSISIIIPVYMVERYIERCVRSIISQTNHKVQIECILVDDASPDNSISIVNQLLYSYEGSTDFKIVKHKMNLGLSEARNTGIRHATGDYFLFVDSDDYITEDCIEKFMETIELYPNVEVVKGNHIGRMGVNVSRVPQSPMGNDSLMELFYLSYIPCMAWNTLIKRSVIEKWQLFFVPGILYEDSLWSYQLFRHVDSFVFIADRTYYYEEYNDNSITSGNKNLPDSLKVLPSYAKILEERLKTFDVKHEVSYTLFVITPLLQMVDMIMKDKRVDDTMRYRLSRMKLLLTKVSLRHFRLILVVFELVLYWPFNRLIRFRLFRHHYDDIMKSVYILASYSPFNLLRKFNFR